MSENKTFLTLPNRKSYMVRELELRFLCPECDDLLSNASQTSCGCRFCALCIRDVTTCPSCNDHQDGSSSRDRAMEREIGALEARCPFIGCKQSSHVASMDSHMASCPFKLVSCSDCAGELAECELPQHKKFHCPKRPVTCQHCGANMLQWQLEAQHLSGTDVCASWMADECPLGCGESLQPVERNVKRHLQEKCRLAPSVECSMKTLGCNVSGTASEMKQHDKADMEQHMRLLQQELIRVQRQQPDNGRVQTLEKINAELRDQMQSLEKNLSKQKTEIEQLKKDMINCHQQLTSCVPEIELEPMSAHSELSSVSMKPIRATGNEYEWRVDEFKSLMNGIKRGTTNQPYLLSPHFYLTGMTSTDGPGYKMQLKLFPFGDGAARTTHISLFFVLLRGDQDNELNWPFTWRLVLTAVSSRAGTVDHSVKLRPDNNPSCYGRPQMLANLAAGVPRFLSLDRLMEDSSPFLHDGHALMLRLRSKAPL